MQRTALLVVLASCASDANEPSLDPDHAKQVATSIASTLRPVSGGGELAAMLDAAELVRGGMPADLARDEDGTVSGHRAGFALRYGIACRDDHNVARTCDARTDNADLDATWSTVLANRAYVMVSTREGTWILNDITPERLRLDGESHFEYASRVIATDEGHALSYDADYRNVILVRGERWPRAGLVRYALSVDDSTTVRAEARFHASGRATIVLADHAFDLDLATGVLRAAR